jgi:hypothetical protein
MTKQMQTWIKSEIYTQLAAHQFIKRSDLLMHLCRHGEKLSDREMRRMVEDMVMLDGLCIASTPNGYRLIRSDQQLLDAVEYLRKKAKPIAIRANKLIGNYQRQYGRQLNLTFNV